MANLKNTTIDGTVFRLPAGDTAARPTGTNGAQLRFNTETGKLEQFRPGPGAWIAPSNTGVIATGGDAVYDVDAEGTAYRVHVFTATGTSTFEVLQGGEAEYLIVAGGGSGGTAGSNICAGGGGAGGLLQGTKSLSAQSYSITVGAGGASVNGGDVVGNKGNNSSAMGETAVGGGGGGGNSSQDFSKQDGGSGGGGKESDGAGGSGTAGQGNDGGDGSESGDYAGGGGGAGAAGNDFDPGIGIASSITGTSIFYAGGGASNIPTKTVNFGALGGGGDSGGDGGDGESGTANTGGGGGGSQSNTNSGAGGSGIVIVRYPLRQNNPETAAGNKIQKNLFYEFDFAKPTVFQQGDTVVRDSRLFEQPTSSISGSPQYLDPRTHRSHLSFNSGGGSQRVNTPFLVNEFPINSTFALEVWLKITNYPQPLSSPNQYGNIRIDGFVFGAANYGGLGIEYRGNDSGTACNVQSYIRTTSSSSRTSQYSMPLNTWTHLVLVRDSSLRLYVDGDLFDSTSVGSGDYNRISNAGVMRFPSRGISGGGTDNYRYLQDSQYAIVRTYKTALTADEVAQSFNADRWRFGV